MTAPGGGSAAAVWVSVLPDLSGFGAKLVRDVGGAGDNAGERIGREMGASTESGFQKNIAKIAAVGAAIGAGLAVAMVGAMNVEAANDKLAAQLGLTAQDAERYGRIAGALYSGAYGDSLETVNEALRLVTLNVGGTATASDVELQKITASVLDVATAFDQDLGGTTIAVGQLMRNGLAPDANAALDIVTAGFQHGADKAGDFLDTLNEYGTQFRKLGLDGATATGLISQGLKAGARDADLVADAIKEFSIRAIDGSKLSGEGFRALGLDGAEMARKIAAGGPQASGALDLVLDRLRAMPDPVKRSQVAVALFGTQAEDLGDALFALDPSTAVASLGEVGGAATRMGQTLNDNATTNLESFKRQVISAFVDNIGGKVIPIVSGVATFLATTFGPALAFLGSVLTTTVIPALTAFGSFLAQNQTPISIIAGIITAVLVPALIAWGFQATITAAKVVAAWLGTQASAIAAGVTHTASVVAMVAGWVLLGVQSLLNAAKVAAAWLIALGPIALVIAAVVAVVAVIIANWDTIRAVTEAVFTFIGNFLTAVWNGIVAVFNTSVAFLVGLWNGFWSGVQLVATTVWNAVVGFITTVWNGIVAVFNASVGFIVGLWNGFWGGVQNVATTVWNAIKTTIDTVWNGIVTVFNTSVGFVAGLWNGFWGGLRTVASTVFGAIKSAIDTVIGGIVAAFEFVVRKVNEVWSGIKRVLAIPINFMIGTVYNGGIVKAWNFVARLLGLNEIQPIPLIAENARGGIIPGYSPGVDDQLSRVSGGEAIMRPEWTRAMGSAYVNAANKAAREGGVAGVAKFVETERARRARFTALNSGRLVEGADHEGPGISRSGFGGVKPWVAATGNVVRQRFGVRSIGGVGSRPGPSDHPSGHALDFMTYTDRGLGDRVAGYLQANAAHHAIKYLIWQQRINSGGGWKGMENRGSVTANHFDHVHASFLSSPGGGRSFSGEGGGGVFQFILDQVRKLYDGVTSPIPALITALVGSPPPEFRTIPPGMARTVIKSVGDFLFGKAEDVDSGGFDRGGVAHGAGLVSKYNLEPERVLSPRQTVAFERLVDHLDAAGIPGNNRFGELNPTGNLERKLDDLIVLLRQRQPAQITVQDRSADPVETARAVQLALRMAR